MTGGKIHYGWVIVVAAFCLIFLDGLLLYTFGVFKPHLSEKINLSETVVSSIFSLRCIALAISMPVAGKLAEKYDPRWLIVFSGAIASSGVFLAGHADSIIELYLSYGILVGLGDGAFYTLPVAIISRWFKENRALAIGIATTGVPVSGFVLSPLSAWLIDNYHLQNAFFIIAAMIFVISLSGLLLRKDPSEMGQMPVGEGVETGNSKADASSVRALDAIRHGAFWVLYFIFWAGFNTFLIVVVNLYDFSIDSGLSTIAAAIPPALVGLGSIFGRIFFSGYVAKFIEGKRVLLICYVFQALTILLVLFFKEVWAFYFFGFLFGFFYSGWIPMFPTMLGNLYGLRELGTIFGFFGSGFSLAAITGPITAGLLLDSMGGYSPMFMAAAFFCSCAAVMTFFVKSVPATANEGET